MSEFNENKISSVKGYDRCNDFVSNDNSLIIGEYMSVETENTIPISTLCSVVMNWDENTNMSTVNVFSCGGYSSFSKLNDFYNTLSNYPYGVEKEELIEKLNELGYKDMTYEK